MHGMCEEVGVPDGNEMHRMCHQCVTKKAQSFPRISNPPKSKRWKVAF